MLCLRDVADRLDAEQRRQTELLIMLAERHRDTPQVGRTLTQHAVPITFGVKVAGWLTGVLDAADTLAFARGRLAVPAGRRGRHPGGLRRARPAPWAARPRGGVLAPRRGNGELAGATHPDALAHRTWSVHRDRRRAGHGDRRLRAPRGRCRHAVAARDRRAGRGERRRFVDNAAQAQSCAVGADPPGSAGHAGTRGDAPPGLGDQPSTSGRTAPGTSSGRRCATSAGGR